ncbi:hypothetical protein M5K25_019708 [Dendrobium thyrsiflorum]|uniref:Uncharacterized protein n=1 Tax=Dendrobium thyrsiflorum TaxID=117978 RepID=A0ABD0UFV8_DENTH
MDSTVAMLIRLPVVNGILASPPIDDEVWSIVLRHANTQFVVIYVEIESSGTVLSKINILTTTLVEQCNSLSSAEMLTCSPSVHIDDVPSTLSLSGHVISGDAKPTLRYSPSNESLAEDLLENRDLVNEEYETISSESTDGSSNSGERNEEEF